MQPGDSFNWPCNKTDMQYPIGQMVHNLNKINKLWKQFVRKASSACFQQMTGSESEIQ